MGLQNAINTTKLLGAWQTLLTPKLLYACKTPSTPQSYVPAKENTAFYSLQKSSSGKVLLGNMSPTVKTLHLVSWDDPKLLNQHQKGLSCSKNQIPNDQCIRHSTRQPKMTTRRINHFPRHRQLCRQYPPPSQQSFLHFQTDASSSLTFIGDQSTN